LVRIAYVVYRESEKLKVKSAKLQCKIQNELATEATENTEKKLELLDADTYGINYAD